MQSTNPQYFGIFEQLLDSHAAKESLPYSKEEARLYDVLQNFSLDLPFYREFCQQHPGPILEIGAGTGRVLLALKELGQPMTAIEKEGDMLFRLQEKEPIANLRVIVGDVMECELPKNQRVILLTLNFLHHLIGRDSKIALLKRLKEAVHQNGYLIIDTDHPRTLSVCSEKTYAMIAESVDSEEPILYVTQSFFDEESGIDYNNSLKIPLGSGLGQLPTVTAWVWNPELEMESLLNEAGWKVVESYGGYDKQPLTENSLNRLYVAAPALNL